MAKSRSEVGYLFRLLFLALGGLVLVSVLGTAGYDLLTDGRYPLFDSFYMTFVTISTIGFGRVEVSSLMRVPKPPARMTAFINLL